MLVTPASVPTSSTETTRFALRNTPAGNGWLDNKASEQDRLAKFHIDEARSSRTNQPAAFQLLLRDAQLGLFDAIVIHKWDRLSRSRRDATRDNVQLRHELSMKLFAVEGLSEDVAVLSGMLFEAMSEAWSEFYSRNLSNETRKGKYQKAREGKRNNRPPFGGEQTPQGILFANERECAGVQWAAESYGNAGLSYPEVAQLLNKHAYLTKQGKPFTAEAVRYMLQDRTYIGEVSVHQEDPLSLATSIAQPGKLRATSPCWSAVKVAAGIGLPRVFAPSWPTGARVRSASCSRAYLPSPRRRAQGPAAVAPVENLGGGRTAAQLIDSIPERRRAGCGPGERLRHQSLPGQHWRRPAAHHACGVCRA